MLKPNYHESVMVEEAIEGLHINKAPPATHKRSFGGRGRYIDATLGNGGHTIEILKRGGHVLGIDLDPEMVQMSTNRLEKEIGNGQAKIVQGNFNQIDKIAKDNDWEPVSGILFDLGVSNVHLKDLERGFSFENPEAKLDMRINPDAQAVKAGDLLNVLRGDQLRDLFEVTLEPGAAKWISGRVIHAREIKPIETVADMLEICQGLRTGKPGLNEATLPFLALRIAVNSELENLKEALPKAFGLLTSGGRLVVISFHSKEDALVKDFFKSKIESGEAGAETFKPRLASESEIETNRKSRSAKMRIIQRI